MNDSGNLERTIPCSGPCARRYFYYELKNGYCLTCRKLLAQRNEERRLLREQKLEQDELLAQNVSKTNDSLKSVSCPSCGRLSLSYSAHYVREPETGSHVGDYSGHAYDFREKGINSKIAETYTCSNWRCRARGRSLSTLQPDMGLVPRMLNKIFPLK